MEQTTPRGGPWRSSRWLGDKPSKGGAGGGGKALLALALALALALMALALALALSEYELYC